MLGKCQSLQEKMEDITKKVTDPQVEALNKQWTIDGQDYYNLSDDGQKTVMGLYNTCKEYGNIIEYIKNIIINKK